MKNLSRITKIIIAITIILVIGQVLIANRLTSFGLTLNKLNQEKQGLDEENKHWQQQIASSSSLTRLAEKAAENGYIKAQTLYLTPKLPVALEDTNGLAR